MSCGNGYHIAELRRKVPRTRTPLTDGKGGSRQTGENPSKPSQNNQNSQTETLREEQINGETRLQIALDQPPTGSRSLSHRMHGARTRYLDVYMFDMIR